MQEKDMVYDALSDLNSSLNTYASMISQTNNTQLRQELQQMRDSCEKRQYDLYKVAEQKGYYKPSQPATPNEIQTVKSEMTVSANMQ
ncbi:MAG: spore coat protein [Epulopiscium sp.]|nr:spore coat protein [Candidatus Epulonipiscium sp.]